MGDTGNMALAMSTLARAEGKRGNDERAKPLLRDAVGLLVQQGNFISLIGPLVALGFMALHSEVQPEGAAYAAQIFGMMATWAEKVGGATPWSEEPMRRSIEQVTATLGADAFAQTFEIGKQMTPADLVQLAEQITAPTPQTILPPPPVLWARVGMGVGISNLIFQISDLKFQISDRLPLQPTRH